MAGAAKKPTPSTAVSPEESPEPQLDKAVETLQEAAAPVADVQENVRKAVEKGVSDTRAAYATVKTTAEEATGAIEASYSAATKGIVAFNTKALESLRVNTEANFDFIKSVITARSVSEVVVLQTEHARRQVEAISAQAKDIAALAQKVATDSAEPIKSQVVKTLKLAV